MEYAVLKVYDENGETVEVVKRGLNAKEAVTLAHKIANENPGTKYCVVDLEEVKDHFSIGEEGGACGSLKLSE